MIKKISLSILVFSVFGTACTNQEAYEAIQKSNLQDCQKLIGAERDRCIQRNQTSYEEYDENRKEALQEN